MTFPVLVQPEDGTYFAELVGAPSLRVSASTRAAALAALAEAIEKRVAQGDLVALEVGARGASWVAGKYQDDPTLREICEEAYRNRDAEPRE